MKKIWSLLTLKLKNKNFIKIKKSYFDKKNIDINKIVVSSKVSLIKNAFRYFFGCNGAKKFRPLGYFFQKWVYIEEIFIKLNVCAFW